MMHIFFNTITAIAPLFLIVFGTALLRRTHLIKEDWSIHLNRYAHTIGLPALIFTSIATMPIAFTNEITLIAENSLFIIIIFLLSLGFTRIFRLRTKLAHTIIMCLMFSNVAYLGIPILTQIYDKTILSQLSVIIAIYLLGLFGLGVTYLELVNRKSHQSLPRTIFTLLCTNPLLIAIIAGSVVNGLQIPIPSTILSALQLIANSVTPIVLIVIGIFIGQSAIGNMHDWLSVVVFTCATLLLLPLIFYGGFLLFNIKPALHYLSILGAAMPLGITPFALADRYGLDKNFIARAIVLSTTLSLVTIPLWVMILS